MKNDIINTEALSSYIKGHLDVVSLLNLLIHILEQIRDGLEDGKQQRTSQSFDLEGYKHLSFTDEQIRKAIERLREEHLLTQKVNWLGVFKVLLWTRVLVDDYGCYTKAETYLKRLFPNDLRLDGLANSLSKKCSRDSFLQKNLECWIKDKRQDRYGVHLLIAQRFLTLLQEG
ncbi:hypothetical protein JQM84_08690 [Parabacteroides distasonis]|nr:hypothetical protein [Parabacteroides distasonis]